MQQHEIHHYLHRFFTANHCEVLAQTDYHLDVQLTIEMDKLLMNRPFYWHYLEKTGGVPNPMRLTFITDQNKAPEDLKGEPIHYGSPRLHQIFGVSRNLGSYIRMYERVHAQGQQTPLHPWLGVNIKVSYQCDRKKDTLYSLGLHLLTGTMVNNFHETLQQVPLTPKIPDFCFTLSPIIKPQSGIKRVEEALKSIISQEDHTWATEARKRWNHDLQLLHKFYEDKEELPDSFEVEKQALKEQYEPQIVMQVINAGLFYLSPRYIQ
ncbi:YqhG family protein [Ectobacillus sp. JY-23]|uniref:YqhG family protein n=1 Tax=Ectobacillus sp. JY-23 TaxID=2933872 RepID=UPI001FF11813|nr:YqhG family protein [Ectobacillus sp. JY-23]UOY93983.1 YqhG family protein [Ectobacillus sp. JY-23]